MSTYVTSTGAPYVPPRTRPSTFRRVMSKVVKVEGTGCWLWTGALSKKGTPNFSNKGGTTNPARYLFERTARPIPKGFRLRRTCQNVVCVSPEHARLEQTRSYVRYRR